MLLNRIVNKSWRTQVIAGVDYACDLKTAKTAVLKAATVQITKLGDNAIEITL